MQNISLCRFNLLDLFREKVHKLEQKKFYT